MDDVLRDCYHQNMSRIAEKLTTKIMNYLGQDVQDKRLQTTAVALGLRAALKYLHYQSAKNIYKIKEPKD